MNLCLDKYQIDGREHLNKNIPVIIFAHGAGAGMDHDFMSAISAGLVEQGRVVVRFNFPYMQANKLDGKRRPPDRAPKLLQFFREQLEQIRRQLQVQKVILLGKSMGGRMAATLAATLAATEPASKTVHGVICLGYPFVPLKGGEPRLAPIVECQAPLLIVQGERDKMGSRTMVDNWHQAKRLPADARIEWLNDGDHSFVPRKSAAVSLEDNYHRAIKLCNAFIDEVTLDENSLDDNILDGSIVDENNSTGGSNE